MPDVILCKICGKRRAKRACPAVHGDICPMCCGTEREVTLSCPFDCEYLLEAHRREKPVEIPESELSNPDIKVTEQFVREHEELLLFAVYSLVQATLHTESAVDTDILAALAALVQTYRTLDSGLVYETRAENQLAAGIQRSFTASIAEYEKMRSEREALSLVRNADILSVLVFLHRVGQQNQNGKPRGRLFLSLLRQMTPVVGVPEAKPVIIL